jgi:Domain of unknown function (DUF4279)
MTPKIAAEFGIYGSSLRHDQLTSMLAIGPACAWCTGDLIPGTVMKRKEDGWVYTLPAEEGYEIDGLAQQLKRALSNWQNLLPLVETEDIRCQLQFVVEVQDETPSLGLSADTITWISKLSASVDIDLHLLAKDRS